MQIESSFKLHQHLAHSDLQTLGLTAVSCSKLVWS